MNILCYPNAYVIKLDRDLYVSFLHQYSCEHPTYWNVLIPIPGSQRQRDWMYSLEEKVSPEQVVTSIVSRFLDAHTGPCRGKRRSLLTFFPCPYIFMSIYCRQAHALLYLYIDQY